jgi:SHS2 domain-containing protein
MINSEAHTLCWAGQDLQSLLYNFMNELLFKFITDSFCTKRVTIKEFKRDTFEITAALEGDIFDLTKHTVGTEIKAITYSAMQIIETPERADLFVIVDI